VNSDDDPVKDDKAIPSWKNEGETGVASWMEASKTDKGGTLSRRQKQPKGRPKEKQKDQERSRSKEMEDSDGPRAIADRDSMQLGTNGGGFINVQSAILREHDGR